MTWTRQPPTTTGTYLVFTRRNCNRGVWKAGILEVHDHDLPLSPKGIERLYQVPGLSHVEAVQSADMAARFEAMLREAQAR